MTVNKSAKNAYIQQFAKTNPLIMNQIKEEYNKMVHAFEQS